MEYGTFIWSFVWMSFGKQQMECVDSSNTHHILPIKMCCANEDNNRKLLFLYLVSLVCYKRVPQRIHLIRIFEFELSIYYVVAWLFYVRCPFRLLLVHASSSTTSENSFIVDVVLYFIILTVDRTAPIELNITRYGSVPSNIPCCSKKKNLRCAKFTETNLKEKKIFFSKKTRRPQTADLFFFL